MKIIKLIFILCFGLIGLNLNSQDFVDSLDVPAKIYKLGEVIISEKIDRENLTFTQIQKHNSLNIANSLNVLPSIVFNNIGERNEGTVYIRGFDKHSIPVFIDGVPVYSPYDGYIDLTQFTTADISSIEVSKGFSSILYGPNTIGGAINLVSVKPSKKLEIHSKLGSFSGNGFLSNFNLGGKRKMFYFQTNLSFLDKKYIPLSQNFETSKNETDFERDNSYKKDFKSGVKIGFTPNENDEYSINYIYQYNKKGNPIYLGNDINTRVRYWDWPKWKKESIYFISKTAINLKTYLKVKMYYDKFNNELKSYDDNTYSTQNFKSSFTSYYDDHTFGGNLELISDIFNNNTIKFALHFKNDNHREHNLNEPYRNISDNTISIGLENIYKPIPKLSLVPGISYNIRKSVKAEDYDSKNVVISNFPKNTNDAINAQLGLYYSLCKKFDLNFNAAYKTRFATMKDRYSYKINRALPNPNLNSEKAMNYELGIKYKPTQNLILKSELFYSKLYNSIQFVSNVQDDLSQMQNTGEAKFAGFDISLNYNLLKNIILNGSYSYIKRDNITNPEILFTNIPKSKLIGAIEYRYEKKFSINLFGEYNSERINASDASRTSPEFIIINTQLLYNFSKYFKIEFGINNIFDKNYTIFEGYPEPGRNFYTSIYFNFEK